METPNGKGLAVSVETAGGRNAELLGNCLCTLPRAFVRTAEESFGLVEGRVEDDVAQAFRVPRVEIARTVHEKRRRRIDATSSPTRYVTLDPTVDRRIVEIGREADEIESGRRRMRVERLMMEHAGISKELVVHLPEFALSVRCFGGTGGKGRSRVLPGEGKVTKDESHGPAQLVEIADERRKRPRAVETFEVSVFNDSDKGVRCPTCIVLGIDRIGELRST